MLDQVTGMRVFVRVAAMGSLAAAGRDLRLSQTMVTKHVDAVEARLGVRLLHRTTRRLTLTEAGRIYLEACGRILGEIAEAEEGASAGQAEARGHLRMNVPVSFGTRQIAPLLGDFSRLHPKVQLEFGLNDRVVDLVEEGWDLAIRIGVLGGSSLVSRKLAPCRTVVCASPGYIDANGAPRKLVDLAHHNCLGYTLSRRMASISGASASTAPSWRQFPVPSGPITVMSFARRRSRGLASSTNRPSWWNGTCVQAGSFPFRSIKRPCWRDTSTRCSGRTAASR